MQFIMTYFAAYRANAVEEIKKVDQEAVCEKITWECTLIMTEMEKKDFIAKLQAIQPIFIRHIMPIDDELSLTDDASQDLPMILDAVKNNFLVEKERYFTIQARVFDGKGDYNAKSIEIYLGEYYEALGGIPVFSDEAIINYDIWVVSVFIKGKHCGIGYSRAADNLNFQCNEYRVLGKRPPVISRAENKLKEAITKFQINVSGAGYALDVGAAPGGWTKVLADYGYQVCAVDPGELDKQLASYDNIKHYKGRIEEMHFEKPFDLVTCDMNVDALIAARIMCSLHSKMSEGASCILTLKLPFRDEESRIEKSIHLLKNQFEIIKIKNLTHNRREVTVYMKRKNIAAQVRGDRLLG